MKKFCHSCGAKYIDGQEHPWECSGCGSRSYASPVPGAEIALFDADKRVVLIKRAADPGKGLYDLPGGFMEVGETLEQCMFRELEEEIGLSAADTTQPRYAYSQASSYQWGKELIPTLTVTFVAMRAGDKQIEALDGVSSVHHVGIGALDEYEFFNPVTAEVIRAAHRLVFGS